MSTPFQPDLLRRTFAALAIASGLGFASEVQAQGTVTLTGATGNNCSYQSMSITPNGNVNVTCAGSPPPPPPPPPPAGQTISISPATLQAAPSSDATLSIKRNNGTAGAYHVYWELSGAGCRSVQPQPAIARFDDNGASSLNIKVGVGSTLGSVCSARVHVIEHLGGATGTTIWEGQNTSTITVAEAPPPPPPPTGCPTGFTPPDEMVSAQFGGEGNLKTQLLKSGQVVSFPVPAVGAQWSSATLTMSEIASSPQPVTIEMSVNTCAGLIEPDTGGNACHVRTQFGHNNKVQLLTKPYGGFNENTPPSQLSPYGLCWAGSTGKQYFLNVRWTYPTCNWGLGACGYNFQYNPGPY